LHAPAMKIGKGGSLKGRTHHSDAVGVLAARAVVPRRGSRRPRRGGIGAAAEVAGVQPRPRAGIEFRFGDGVFHTPRCETAFRGVESDVGQRPIASVLDRS
jgi:hypothetical protein